MSNYYFLDPNCLECNDKAWFDKPCDCCDGWESEQDDSPECPDCEGTGVLHEPCKDCNPEGER